MTFVAVLEQMGIESRLPDDRIGIDAEIAQGRRDFLGDPQMNVAGRKRPPAARQEDWLPRCGILLAASCSRRHDVIDHHDCLAEF